MRSSAPTLALLVGLGGLAGAQDQHRLIRGSVQDSTGSRIAYAIVQTTGQSRVVSDDSGRFEYRAVPRGELRLIVRRLGYRPLELRMDPSSDTTIALVLDRIPRVFDAIVVEASRTSERLRAAGFYDRLNDRNKGLGSGIFVTAEDIEQRNPLRTSQVLDQFPGIRVEKMSADFDDFVFRGSGGCLYTVYLNGTRIGPRLGGGGERRSSRPGSTVYAEEVRIDRFIEPSAVAGIEVYARAVQPPPHLQMLNGTCGVVAVWSK